LYAAVGEANAVKPCSHQAQESLPLPLVTTLQNFVKLTDLSTSQRM
jgi:hypothetical protein